MIKSHKNQKIELNPNRILLKQLNPEDVSDRYVRWLNDSEVNKFLEIRHSTPLTKQDAIKFVIDCEKHHRHHWGIFFNNEHVGNISCNAYNHIYRWVDISSLIGEKKYRASNLAKFALAGAIEYLFTVSNFHRIQAGTYSVHFSGITLLTNLGFKKEAVLREAAIVDNKYVDVLKFGLLKHEWLSKSRKLPKVRVQRMPWE